MQYESCHMMGPQACQALEISPTKGLFNSTIRKFELWLLPQLPVVMMVNQLDQNNMFGSLLLSKSTVKQQEK